MKRLPSRSLKIAAAFVAAVALGAGGGVAAYAVASDTTQTVVRQVTVTSSEPAANDSALSVSALYDRVHQGVVTIRVETPQGQALGSGFVIDDQGHVVTNDHVVAGATSISVEFADGSTHDAQLVGTDASTDIAVIKVSVPSSELQPLSLSDSSAVQVGDAVVAIGSPLGLNETVTSGIVSALHRTITSPNNFSINDAIQTDAAINHGNSGGPLLDLQGHVIGINSQIESDSGGNDGIGFAVPSNTVKSVVSQLLASGKVEHAYLGVGIATITDALSSQLGLPAGVEVTQVAPGGPAAHASLKAADATTIVGGQEFPTGGDVITAVDGRKISTSEELQSAIGSKKPGDTITLTYSRDGSEHSVDLTLGTRPS
ncbi:MAG TPA: trypsin-like peptidase domain-containing protein [Gaiellaceae bacterium]|nr:trypsin-like peptidase domain-containing protein [Gaiellaceae bacterium]